MPERFGKLFLAVGLMVALWGLSAVRRPGGNFWLHPAGTNSGPVRILRFYATVGTLTPGQTAQLCYAVENAKIVRISPMQTSDPAQNRCIDVVPEHTTHYTLLAEGYDGMVATRSFTLAVQQLPAPTAEHFQYARWDRPPGLSGQTGRSVLLRVFLI
jgi:hypothetical protein